jgi:hypothetical protein
MLRVKETFRPHTYLHCSWPCLLSFTEAIRGGWWLLFTLLFTFTVYIQNIKLDRSLNHETNVVTETILAADVSGDDPVHELRERDESTSLSMGLTQWMLLCHFRPFFGIHNDVLARYLSRVPAFHQTAYSYHPTWIFRPVCSWKNSKSRFWTPASYSFQYITCWSKRELAPHFTFPVILSFSQPLREWSRFEWICSGQYLEQISVVMWLPVCKKVLCSCHIKSLECRLCDVYVETKQVPYRTTTIAYPISGWTGVWNFPLSVPRYAVYIIQFCLYIPKYSSA